eukprot:s11166_g1.t1
MGISLFVGRLVTPFAETAFAYLKGHPVAGVAALAILVGGFKLISGGEEEKEEEKPVRARSVGVPLSWPPWRPALCGDLANELSPAHQPVTAWATGSLPRDHSSVTTAAAAAAAPNFFSKVFAAGAQGATAAFVAAILSAICEPLVNRLLVKRMTISEALKEMNFKLISNFFLTTFPTNMLKFPVFEIINMAMTFTAFSPGMSGTISGFLFCTAMLPARGFAGYQKQRQLCTS